MRRIIDDDSDSESNLDEGSDEGDQIEVIYKHRVRNDSVEFFCKWVGYEAERDKTWQAMEDTALDDPALMSYLASIGIEYNPDVFAGDKWRDLEVAVKQQPPPKRTSRKPAKPKSAAKTTATASAAPKKRSLPLDDGSPTRASSASTPNITPGTEAKRRRLASRNSPERSDDEASPARHTQTHTQTQAQSKPVSKPAPAPAPRTAAPKPSVTATAPPAPAPAAKPKKKSKAVLAPAPEPRVDARPPVPYLAPKSKAKAPAPTVARATPPPTRTPAHAAQPPSPEQECLSIQEACDAVGWPFMLAGSNRLSRVAFFFDRGLLEQELGLAEDGATQLTLNDVKWPDAQLDAVAHKATEMVLELFDKLYVEKLKKMGIDVSARRKVGK